jgi:V-type H+-transporting ATPase subunit a
MSRRKNIAPSLFFEEVEDNLKKTEQFVLEQTKKAKDMHDAFNQLLEYRTVLRETRVILGYQANRQDIEIVDPRAPDTSSQFSINPEEADGKEVPLVASNTGVKFVNISGTINTDEVMRFRKLIFRATRGNALVYFSDIKKPIVDFYGVPY